MKVTINDVAKQAGVSIKTVSRVINQEAGVKQATYDKVMAAVSELNYQPNVAARNLASSSAFAIGFVYDNPNAYYVIDMQVGLLSVCQSQGYELVIHPCHSSEPDIVTSICEWVDRSRLAGVVLTPPLSEREDMISALEAKGVSFVRIVSGDGELANTVFINDRQAAADITQHLLQQGHQRIGFLSGGQQHKSTTERHRGYLDALASEQIEACTELAIDGDYSFESGVAGAKALLALDNPPTAIFACNDEIAAGALFAARLQQVEIPKQLAIAGFEDSPFSRQTWPKLTTAHQPNQKIAQHAAELLLANRRAKATPEQTCFTPELVVRASSCDGAEP
ncbi:LacI family DNA-binding transcriptional regulator [Paraferrimonas sedimenticola]|uniref:LacI family transcriptional regulator n=1 Tax=Paraferrimonas sedimenticola TaxID=375674 RepID=A0AA37RTL2_9GAMM|nr:LacI family DNA-binding transcriptional regulator [Paraferrimonas sedimenticola]GLP95076.1 LacI family transcriptional regulator [Paraferrimonas sedimenticola]